ncbi:hypothetical protein [Rahnella sp. PCH160]|uniref:hypothetical protein n=1 Tax=Rahnella sp. PCH160 TaxID=3447928 RepID=UPI0039FDB016
MEKLSQLTPSQLLLVDKIAAFVVAFNERFPDGLEEDLEVFGPPEAFYHPPKDWTKLP